MTEYKEFVDMVMEEKDGSNIRQLAFLAEGDEELNQYLREAYLKNAKGIFKVIKALIEDQITEYGFKHAKVDGTPTRPQIVLSDKKYSGKAWTFAFDYEILPETNELKIWHSYAKNAEVEGSKIIKFHEDAPNFDYSLIGLVELTDFVLDKHAEITNQRKTNPKTVKRYHFSKTPITELKHVRQNTSHWAWKLGKPNGLWYSCGSSWHEFIHYNDLSSLYIYELEIDLRFLKIIRTKEELDALTSRFGLLGDPSRYEAEEFTKIDWQKVSIRYLGIEICPYIHERRYTGFKKVPLIQRSSWYYSWDVASGCIWNPKAIKSITQISAPEDDLYYELEDFPEETVLSKEERIYRAFTASNNSKFQKFGAKVWSYLRRYGLKDKFEFYEEHGNNDILVFAYIPDITRDGFPTTGIWISLEEEDGYVDVIFQKIGDKNEFNEYDLDELDQAKLDVNRWLKKFRN